MEKTSADILVDLARECEDMKDLFFLVIGDGAEREKIVQKISDLEVSNIKILPFLNQAEYKEMLADVDVIFVAQRSGAGDNFFPSKLLGIMASSKPMLVAADQGSELALKVRETGSGLVSSYGDVGALKKNLLEYKPHPGPLEESGKKGRVGVEEYGRARVLADWVEQIEGLARKNS